MTKQEAAKKETPLEKHLERLEQIVEKLESGETPLEKSIELYEEGRRLGLECQKRLDRLDKRVQQVRETLDGRLEVEPFEGDSGE